jgi:hypothetical protein
LRRIPREEVPRILAAAESLITDPYPHGCETLTGTDAKIIDAAHAEAFAFVDERLHKK